MFLAKLKPYRWHFIIAAAVLVVFGQSIFYPLTMPDDGLLIVLNPVVNSPSLHGVIQAWKPQIGLLYIPLTTNFWSLLALMGGASSGTTPPELNAFVYHGANVLLHLISAMVLYRILRSLFKADWACAVGALIWAIHPLQAEPVSWAAGMKDVLSGLLAILAIWAYTSAAGQDGQLGVSVSRLWIWRVVAGVLLLAASLAKPGGAGFPLAAVAIGWLLMHKPLRKAVLWALPMFVAILPTIILTSHVQAVGKSDFVTPLWTRPFIAGHALAVYVQHVLWPYRLTMDYGMTPKRVIGGVVGYVAWLVPAAVTVVLVILYRRGQRSLLAGWVIFVAGLLPVLGLVSFGHQFRSTVTDRYAYLALFGVAVVAAGLMDQRQARLFQWAGACVCIVMAALCFSQVKIWRDCQTFGSHLIAANPQTSIGYHMLAVGKMDDAVRLSRKGKAQSDAADKAQYFRLSDDANAQAEQFLHEAIEREPGNLAALQDLVAVYRREGKRSEALTTLERALEVIEAMPPEYQPESEDRLKAADVFMRRGEYDRARIHAQKFLARHPDNEKALQLLKQIDARAATQPTTQIVAPSDSAQQTKDADR